MNDNQNNFICIGGKLLMDDSSYEVPTNTCNSLFYSESIAKRMSPSKRTSTKEPHEECVTSSTANAEIPSSSEKIKLSDNLNSQYSENGSNIIQHLMMCGVSGMSLIQQSVQILNLPQTFIHEKKQGLHSYMKSATESCVADDILKEERTCSIENVSNFGDNDPWMFSVNNAGEDKFSNILADCLSYISLGLETQISKHLELSSAAPKKDPVSSISFPSKDASSPDTVSNNTNVNRCHVCYKLFRGFKPLKIHMKRHQSLPNIKCTECGKLFYELSVLKKHKQIHSKSKPYACGFCSTRFNQKSNMLRHCRRNCRYLSK